MVASSGAATGSRPSLSPADVAILTEQAAVKEWKTQQFYDELELSMEDLDRVEKRIQELEEYIGVDPNVELEDFVRNEVENIGTKCNRVEDFITIVEDRNFMLNDFFSKTDQLEKLLKNGKKFAS